MKRFQTPEMARKAREQYEVGYCKPPKIYQFRKNQSGNPKGRPKKKANSIFDDVVSVLAQKISVTKDGRTQKISKQKALIQAMVIAALKGKRSARKDLIELMKALYLIEAPAFDGDEDEFH